MDEKGAEVLATWRSAMDDTSVSPESDAGAVWSAVSTVVVLACAVPPAAVSTVLTINATGDEPLSFPVINTPVNRWIIDFLEHSQQDPALTQPIF
jgi:hypothetical protein